MNLVSTLCAGISAAANGWAEIYIRGTTTRATVYYAFEAPTSDSSGANIALDAYGAVEVYVNQLVDIVAKSPDGTVVRSWTDGYSSPNVEVISPAFTGHDYVSGAAAVNKPTTLQAVLDLYATSSGSKDWKVLIGGVEKNLQNAFGSLNGLVFNVKDPTYGAVGDGVTNDQTAIASALAAAVAAGGGVVFFPKGTYLVTTAIEWDHKVSIAGVGASLSVITTNSPSNARILTWTSGTAQSGAVHISDVGFAASQANTGEQLYCNVAVNLVTERCWFGATTNATGVLVNLAGSNSRWSARDCRFTINSGTNHAATWSTTSTVVVQSCLFITSSTAGFNGSMVRPSGARDTIRDCVFDISSLTGATTAYGVEAINTGALTVSGCRFVPLAQTFTYCIKLLAGGTVTTSENDFSFQSSSTWYAPIGALLANGSKLQLYGAERVSGSAAAYTLGDACEVYEISSSGTAPTLTGSTMFYPGQTQRLILRNASGGNWAALAFGLNVAEILGATAVNTTLTCCVDFVVADPLAAGTYSWYAVYFLAG